MILDLAHPGPITIDRWTSYDEAQALRGDEGRYIGGFGGWFGFHRPNTWDDYVKDLYPWALPYYRALRHEVVRRRIRRGGDWHQESKHGAPVFSDGLVGLFSMRAWGDFLAAVWTHEDGRSYTYLDFYMDGWSDHDIVYEGPEDAPTGPGDDHG